MANRGGFGKYRGQHRGMPAKQRTLRKDGTILLDGCEHVCQGEEWRPYAGQKVWVRDMRQRESIIAVYAEKPVGLHDHKFICRAVYTTPDWLVEARKAAQEGREDPAEGSGRGGQDTS